MLKTDEVNSDYILALILEKSKENEDIESLKQEAKRFIEKAIIKGHVEYAGDELDKLLLHTSRRQGVREKRRKWYWKI